MVIVFINLESEKQGVVGEKDPARANEGGKTWANEMGHAVLASSTTAVMTKTARGGFTGRIRLETLQFVGSNIISLP